MDTDSAEYRAWQESPSASSSIVPRWTHAADDLAKRASSHYIEWADRIGLKFSVWSASGFKVGSEGGKVAEMTFRGAPWSVWVDAAGQVTARPDN